jgi:serine/threonine protein kinase
MCPIETVKEKTVKQDEQKTQVLPTSDPQTTDPGKDISVVKLIAKSKFSVYHVHSTTHGDYYAMKVFPYTNGKISTSYISELRLSSLSHPNILSIVEARSLRIGREKGERTHISYFLLELAPYGDLGRAMKNDTFPVGDEKLIRTYFRQLINGLEYLHTKKIAHMDLKLDNLLLGENYDLKIADFDLCIFGDERYVYGRGTENFRAPEVQNSTGTNYTAGDIYAAGICLFALMAQSLPYSETKLVNGNDLRQLLFDDQKKFWKYHEASDHVQVEFSKDFKSLFESMVKYNPEERASLDDIKGSKWYKGSIYSPNQLKIVLQKILPRLH